MSAHIKNFGSRSAGVKAWAASRLQPPGNRSDLGPVPGATHCQPFSFLSCLVVLTRLGAQRVKASVTLQRKSQ